MSTDLFNILWLIIFTLVISIAVIANMIIIMAILRDRSMHTSTYFYIINVNIADIILVLSSLPERIAAVFYSSYGFHLGLYTCKFEKYRVNPFVDRCLKLINNILLLEKI